MNIFLIIVPVVLVLPAAYLLLKYRNKSKPMDGRQDATERRELRGPEQARHREEP